MKPPRHTIVSWVKHYFLAVICVVFYGCCGGLFLWDGLWHSVEITDVTQPQNLSFQAHRMDTFLLGTVSGFSIQVVGEIDGEATFATAGELQTFTGKVDWRLYHDHFRDTHSAQYLPKNVTKGYLKVHYQFH